MSASAVNEWTKGGGEPPAGDISLSCDDSVTAQLMLMLPPPPPVPPAAPAAAHVSLWNIWSPGTGLVLHGRPGARWPGFRWTSQKWPGPKLN